MAEEPKKEDDIIKGLEGLSKPDYDNVKCYCCFGGNSDKGIVSLDELKDKVISLKDHNCPPWGG